MPFSDLSIQLPPLDWTLHRLTGIWPEGDEMISCPLPGHDDSTPSFNLWDPDSDGVPQRYGCFGCSRGGDAVDLIAALEGLPHDEALRRAGELAALAAQEDQPKRQRPKPVPPKDLEAVYQRIVKSMGPREYETRERFCRDKFPQVSEEFLTYLEDVWGWMATTRDLVMPHRGPDQNMTGLKYRYPPFGQRDRRNEEPSTFPHLYGAWLDVHRNRVLLCEGESDAVWAAWQLRNEPIDVLALPSGAGAKLRDEWLKAVEGREVIAAFDSDEAGFGAARLWVEARPDIKLARLPEKEDIVSCGVPVRELIERAETPVVDTGIITVSDGSFAQRKSQGGPAAVADFWFEPERELRTQDGPAWEGRISGSAETALIRSADLHTGSSLTRWANRHGRAWLGGSGVAVQGTYNWLRARSAYLPLEQASTKAGKIGRSYVGPSFCIGADRYRYIPPALGDSKLETKLHIAEGPWNNTAIKALEQLNDPAVMAAMLGWLCATLLRGEKAPAPPLFVSGESGAGKTQLLSTFFGSFGFKTEMNLTTTTPYGVDCMVNSTIGFPVWFDEFRGGAREDSMMRLRQLLRDAYNGQPSMKGGMTQHATELTEVTTWAGIVVSGEMSSQETSHRDRMIMIDLDPSAKSPEAYAWLNGPPERTQGLGFALLTFLAKRPATLFKVRPADVDAPDRFKMTLGFVEAGWAAWKEFRWENGIQTPPQAEPDLQGMAGERRDSEDPWMQALKHCEGTPTPRGTGLIVQQRPDGLVVIPSEVIVEARRVGIELPARSNELVQWLRARWPVEDTRVDGRRAKLVRGLKI